MLRTERQKELMRKYREKGTDGLEYKELLELLIAGYATEGEHAEELIERLESRYGSIDRGLDMSAEELMHVKGMNKQTAVLLSMIPQLAARLEADSFGKRPKLDSYEKMEQYARIKYYGKTIETVNVFCLDKNWYLNGMETVATGTIDQVSVYPREIVKQALRYDAAKVIVTHNHPSGDAEPSLEDYAMTDRIIEALVGMEIKLEDHIIIAPDDAYSFANDPVYYEEKSRYGQQVRERKDNKQKEKHGGLDWERIREELRRKELEAANGNGD